jgi:thymidylate synthase
MKQYHEHLKLILSEGTKKAPARPGMPGSISLFGYQNRYDLQKGFPIVTTKKVSFKNIVVELLWFLRGDTNIKYLVDNGCNIWNEDAYNYYVKLAKKQGLPSVDFLGFQRIIKGIWDGITSREEGWDSREMEIIDHKPKNYEWGDCGKQYGWLWRKWEGTEKIENSSEGAIFKELHVVKPIDQLKTLIKGLKANPEGRRHIITAWNPATLDDMALNACHAFVQFNCRALTFEERKTYYFKNSNKYYHPHYDEKTVDNIEGISLGENPDKFFENLMNEKGINIPKYYLDCQLYQRSADIFLGVPYNISSYALLTHIIAKICNMVPGHFIHTFGDSHIYDNHMDQVTEILSRDPEKYPLPELKIPAILETSTWGYNELPPMEKVWEDVINDLVPSDFTLENYQSYPAIKAELSTGLK